MTSHQILYIYNVYNKKIFEFNLALPSDKTFEGPSFNNLTVINFCFVTLKDKYFIV